MLCITVVTLVTFSAAVLVACAATVPASSDRAEPGLRCLCNAPGVRLMCTQWGSPRGWLLGTYLQDLHGLHMGRADYFV